MGWIRYLAKKPELSEVGPFALKWSVFSEAKIVSSYEMSSNLNLLSIRCVRDLISLEF